MATSPDPSPTILLDKEPNIFRHALMLTALLAGVPFIHVAEDVAFAPAATAAVLTLEGEIKKVDTAAGKLTIKHGPLNNLGMEPMTMVFRVQNLAMLGKVQIGSRVRFVTGKVNGALTVTALGIQ